SAASRRSCAATWKAAAAATTCSTPIIASSSACAPTSATCGRTTCTITSRRPTSRIPTRTTSRSPVSAALSTYSTTLRSSASRRSASRPSSSPTRPAFPAAFPSSDLAGQGATTLSVHGEFQVKEVFAEIRVPIVEDGFFRYLGLEAGYRYSSYSIQGGRSFSTDTYKIGLDFAPIRDIRFRATYNRAVRAPNIQELFAPQRVAINGNSDPCAGAAPTAPLAACQAQGVSAAPYGGIAGN